MPPSDFANADIPSIVEKLTLEEATALIAGVGFWHTHGIERLNIPAVKVSDGPNGVRGNFFFMGTPAKCLPSATALGATFDTDLIHEVGAKLLAPEAKLRSASIILAPTCNIQRNPLGGRSFESFSEDPTLSGLIAAAYVAGIQSKGIGTAIKHYATNDKENDRNAYDSQVSARALREIYLMPFMLAEKYAKPWSVMTAYNKLNGLHVSEDPFMLKDVLRKEWGSDAMIMSDWFGVYSVSDSINAGLDLEMPGTNKWRTWDKVRRSVEARKTTARIVKERAAKVLELVKRCAQGAPDVLDGDGKERTHESEEDMALMRKVAAESVVLLKNEGDLLPLQPSTLKKVAIVGGNAKALVLSGGGSAALKSSYFISPFDGIVKALGENVEVTFAEGARTFKALPSLDNDLVTEKGEKCWVGEWYSNGPDGLTAQGDPVLTQVIDETNAFISVDKPKGLASHFTLHLRGKMKPRKKDTKFEFGLTVAGRAKLYVDGKLLIDNWTRQRRGEAFFSTATQEEKGIFELKAGVSHDIHVHYVNVRGPADEDEDELLMDSNPGIRLGGAVVLDPDEDMALAVQLAKEADLAIVVVGLNSDWESEGYDRTTLALAGRTDELVEKVAAANKKTVVVTQSGSAIAMPWADSVPAIVHAWYLGNSTGDAIADVLTGKVNPSGKMSLTFPKRLEDVPSHGHFHSEHGTVLYSEDLFVGYKHFQHRIIKPLWAFGHGLSYTTFQYLDLSVSKPKVVSSSDGKKDLSITISLAITNTGPVTGSETIQVYVVHPPTSALTQVPLALRAFKKVRDLKPGEKLPVELTLDKYAVSYWEERIGSWTIEKGEYTVHVGSSSDNLLLRAPLVLERSDVFEWNGL
ncbi:beta-glucosidase [Fomitiporia mediterranea MF3/22]|uniref:beta-glucosidase n=1 Tax=Fomitiporia mediterranea (strain MF3/22) TaxID=694068 RepID=UPI00044092D5|nr:beta-glucosidase [Fomitiporia mediterranea MF3/22]EJD06139.1 beta-glucosidase [Fomitiporia mediterranea MF3/22]